MLIPKADFCIFGFVCDEAISIIQCRQHKNPNKWGYSICWRQCCRPSVAESNTICKKAL